VVFMVSPVSTVHDPPLSLSARPSLRLPRHHVARSNRPVKVGACYTGSVDLAGL
jgi:hypothetical protein